MSRRRSKTAVSDASIQKVVASINAKLTGTSCVAHLKVQQYLRGANQNQSTAMRRSLSNQFGTVANELLDCESTDSSGNVKRALCLCAGDEVLSTMIVAFNPKQNGERYYFVTAPPRALI
jgi:hypothetical protein